MHKLESVLENETENHQGFWEWIMRRKIIRDFEIQTDHVIPTRRLDHVRVNKKKRTCRILNFAVLVDHRVKIKENEKKDKYLGLARKLK